jgi:hypothetical protein
MEGKKNWKNLILPAGALENPPQTRDEMMATICKGMQEVVSVLGFSYNRIGRDVGAAHNSVRTWIIGETAMPAWFFISFVRVYDVNYFWLSRREQPMFLRWDDDYNFSIEETIDFLGSEMEVTQNAFSYVKQNYPWRMKYKMMLHMSDKEIREYVFSEMKKKAFQDKIRPTNPLD